MGKKKVGIELVTREDVGRALQRIGELRRYLSVAEAETSEKVNQIVQAMVDDTKPMVESLKQNETALEAWAEANKNLFIEPRSIELNWGKVGFRWTPWKIKFLGKLKVETIVEKIRAAKMPSLIRVEYSVDKEKALNYDNETLAPMGMKKVHTDEFYFEVKEIEVK